MVGVGEAPLAAAVEVGPAVALAREVEPLRVAELVALRGLEGVGCRFGGGERVEREGSKEGCEDALSTLSGTNGPQLRPLGRTA